MSTRFRKHPITFLLSFILKMNVVWDITPCNLALVCWRFWRAYCFHHQVDFVNFVTVYSFDGVWTPCKASSTVNCLKYYKTVKIFILASLFRRLLGHNIPFNTWKDPFHKIHPCIYVKYTMLQHLLRNYIHNLWHRPISFVTGNSCVSSDEWNFLFPTAMRESGNKISVLC